MTSKSITKFILILITASILIHFLFGFILGLSVDEAHYLLYGLHPDWSYFDHPPMVGWLQIIPAHYNWPIGVTRLIPQLFWVISILLTMQLTRLIIKVFLLPTPKYIYQTAPWLSAFIIATAPLLHVISVGLVPDTILLVTVPLMMLLTILIYINLNTPQQPNIMLWIFLGITLGVSGLSKYTSIFFALAIPICLIHWQGLKIFKISGLWLGLIIAAVCITPVLYWNMSHDWISLKYQFNHGSGGHWKIKNVGIFFLTQLLCYGFLIPYGLIKIFKYFQKLPTYLFSFSLIPLVVFAVLSGNGGSLPHWTAPAWIAIIPFSSIGLAYTLFLEQKKIIIIFSSLQLALITIGFIFLATSGIPTEKLNPKNPIADLYGWDLAADKIQHLSKQMNVHHMVIQNWTMGSRLAWYTKSKNIHILDQRHDQFDIWFGKMPIGKNALLLQWSQMPYELPTKANEFSTCQKINTLAIRKLHHNIAKFKIFLCKNWGQTHLNT